MVVEQPTAYIAVEAPEMPQIERNIPKSILGSCVKTARHLGVKLPRGDAKDLQPNSTPHVGIAVLLSYPKAEHVAVITGLGEHGFAIAEGNYKANQYTERFIYWNDKSIRGFYNPLNDERVTGESK